MSALFLSRSPAFFLSSGEYKLTMSPEAEELLKKALALPEKERAELAGDLLKSLDGAPSEEGVEEAWDAEIGSRVDDVRSGRVKTIPVKEVMRSLADRRRRAAK